MGAYYTYLISSLPMLNFFAKPAISLKEFFAQCQNLIPPEELEILHNACNQEAYLLDTSNDRASGKWANFEIALRNELVRLRARRKKTDSLRFERPSDYYEAIITHTATLAYRSSSPLEAEKILDQLRWEFLETLSLGHYFDFDSLFVYALKLKILERWEKIKNSDTSRLFNTALNN